MHEISKYFLSTENQKQCLYFPIPRRSAAAGSLSTRDPYSSICAARRQLRDDARYCAAAQQCSALMRIMRALWWPVLFLWQDSTARNTPCAIEFPSLFTPAECDEILKAAKLMHYQDAMLFRRKVNATFSGFVEEYTPSERDGQVAWLPLGRFSRWRWVRMRMEQAIAVGEKAWGARAGGLASNNDVQVSSYYPGGHYTWHTDSEIPSGEKDELVPGVPRFTLAEGMDRRVLSVTVQLSAPSQYSGGEVELAGHGNMSTAQGTVIVFPSFLPHIVHPVTGGLRQSIVGWFKGEWDNPDGGGPPISVPGVPPRNRWTERASVIEADKWLQTMFDQPARVVLAVEQVQELAQEHTMATPIDAAYDPLYDVASLADSAAASSNNGASQQQQQQQRQQQQPLPSDVPKGKLYTESTSEVTKRFKRMADRAVEEKREQANAHKLHTHATRKYSHAQKRQAF